MTQQRRRWALLIAAATTALTVNSAAACQLPRLGEGQVAAIIDAITIRLHDGSEVKLGGLARLPPPRAADQAALTQLLLGREVTLHGHTADPDRYGRQSALVYRAGELVPVQAQLLQQGAAVASGELDDSACRAQLLSAENMARKARAGFWSDPTAIKNPENPGDIMSRMGQFTVVEGRVLTVRSVGATVYVNFGRRWTQDFAVTISRQQVTALESVGLLPKALDKRWVRVRGFIGNRNGPQIAVRHVGQIEVIGDR
ncbi:endonuclease YncB(thermonuclease family) [Rhodopseudomonas faecalis]|uniref:Endonuclease YncB(Thermonuclease family) n=1 Tax=Rhodopseudomonas faecalis TaxID=99655 RepID=A0A318TBR8_9BRAD|nr:thermonuclease family protein [Rhodopseudomonas faecalis]PYF01197.1 endonuclease YncB(thermonuclease family) [Rhodopseudomonas faecalis]TAH66063.1 MAG: thermonuclease family protein [Rhodopseudomonas palustris]